MSARRGVLRVARFASFAIFASLVALSGAVHADERCPLDERAKVLLRAPDIDPVVMREIVDHLRRSLEHRNISVCTDDDGPAVATLAIGAPAPGAFALDLRIDDATVHKSASRDLDAGTIPPDGRALAVAQAADELLRATWPERFRDDGAPSSPAVAAHPERPPGPPPPLAGDSPALPRAQVGLGLGGELFSSGHAQLGPDLDVTVAPISWLAFGVRGGARASASRSSAFGDHETSTLVGSVGAAFRVALGRRVGFDVGPRMTVMRFAFAASPGPGYVARDADALAVCATAEARSWFVPIEPLYVGLAFAAGAPLRAAHAVAGGVRVHEMNGLLAGGQLVIGLAF